VKNGVGGVGGVGEEMPVSYTTNTANTVSGNLSEETATITREPSGAPLSISEEWEEV
jgi:hypothetical protein